MQTGAGRDNALGGHTVFFDATSAFQAELAGLEAAIDIAESIHVAFRTTQRI